MKKIRLKLQERSYDIIVGRGAAGELSGIVKKMRFSGPIAVITDRVVEKKTRSVYKKALDAVTNELTVITVPSGEKSKSVDMFRDVSQKLANRTKGHKPLIVALGGGVIGDLAGFVASSYRRGVPYIQVPTTLLAQVDSSVGGKVGIDLPEAKNLVGAFYQPKAVLVDTGFLPTLPARHIRNGMAEVIKYGIIKKRSFFALLEDEMERLLELKSERLDDVVYECLRIKARLVEKDERDDKDLRIALNFGHTLGHGIEAAAEYTNRYNHGECVSIGMVMASDIAVRLGMFSEKGLLKVKRLLKKAGLPVSVKGIGLKDILRTHRFDKKFVSGTNRFVLPTGIGKVEVVEDIPGILIRTVLREYVS
ncbi:MAG: 3-dehydroquinate synthase [Candidatus Omnitrophica bacterium]|nr:3-dehydroquinate synthase [Candidatus Omnitrophota bacterium]